MKNTHRANDIAAAHRRFIINMVPMLLTATGNDRRYHDICVAVELLSGDEPAALAAFISRTNSLDATIGFLARLLRGQASYGPLDLAADPRNWQHEIEEELADAVAYHVFGEMSGAKIAAVDEVQALAAIGQRTDLSRAIANTKIAQQHRAIGQLCEGGGLRFGWDAVNKPPPLRCHQCGQLFDLDLLELAQRPEYTLIPEHEVRR